MPEIIRNTATHVMIGRRKMNAVEIIKAECCDLCKARICETCNVGRAIERISKLPGAERWRPIKWHYITDEEQEENGYPKDWVYYLDCEMPEDEQEILVTTNHGRVEKDVCYFDGEFSLDSGWDWIDDIVAWMPLPKPHGEDGEA